MRKNRSRKVARLFAAAAIVATTTGVGVTVTAAPALAWPSSCAEGWYSSPDRYTVTCYSGGGEHRAAYYCMNDYSKGTWRYGAWQPNGIWSTASCTSSYPYGTSYKIEKRALV